MKINSLASALLAFALMGCTVTVSSPMLGSGGLISIGGGTPSAPPPATVPPASAPPVSVPPVAVPPPPPPTTPAAVDTNVLPLQLPAGRKAGDTADLGIGPDQIDLYLSSNPSSGYDNSVVVLVNGRPFLAPLVDVMSKQGATKQGDDHFVLHGVFNCPTVKVEIKGVAPNGINALWMNGATCNYADLVANGVYNSRGGSLVNSPSVFVTNDSDITLTPPIAAGAPAGGGSPISTPQPVTTATLTQISATINGNAASGTLDSLCASIPANGTLALPAGKFSGFCFLPNAGVTVMGAGSGKTIIDGTGVRPYQDKALFVPGAANDKFKGLTIQNAAIPEALGGNAAGIRDAGDSIGFNILADVELANNQNGILTFPSNFNFNGLIAHDNGSGSGYTHDVYINGSPSTTLTVANSNISKSNGGHGLKSRAGTTNVSNSTLSAGGNGAALDVPDGGIVSLNGVHLVMPVGLGPTTNLVTFALESARNASAGMTMTMHNVTVDGDGNIVCANGAALILDSTDTYTGTAPPVIVGCAVTGQFRKAG